MSKVRIIIDIERGYDGQGSLLLVEDTKVKDALHKVLNNIRRVNTRMDIVILGSDVVQA